MGIQPKTNKNRDFEDLRLLDPVGLALAAIWPYNYEFGELAQLVRATES